MTDHSIEPGDVCIDLTSGRVLHVMDKAADRADEWSRENNYELCENYGNRRVGAEPSDTVWTCVYSNSIQSEPSKDYAFPESRLARVETEAANDGERVQDTIRFDLLVSMFEIAYERAEMGDVELIDAIAQHATNGTVSERAREYVESGRIGSGGEGSDD